tara:strand:+ start:232 stop:897 length:666 start_codon:yes stop_codon:yes gene_type:complete
MDNIYDLNSILNAIDAINSKENKKITLSKPDNIKKAKKNILLNESILPSTEKLILEAEEYSNKLKSKSLTPLNKTENILILENEYSVQIDGLANLEEIKSNIIDDLYSSVSKKLKKNTLKIIFDLHQKINNLEKKIEVLNTDGTIDNNLKINKKYIINNDASKRNKENTIDKDEKLSDTVIQTLKMQNSIIKDLEKNEQDLRLKIVDLEQDLSLLVDSKNN